MIPYNFTFGNDAFQRYTVVDCDIKQIRGTLMQNSYTIIQIYLTTYVRKKIMNFQFVNEVVFGEYYHGRYEVYSIKRLLNFVEGLLPSP